MVVGINSREDDLAVNVCREKKMTNIRSSTSDIAVRLTPPVRFSLEESLDFLAADELLEVTPKTTAFASASWPPPSAPGPPSAPPAGRRPSCSGWVKLVYHRRWLRDQVTATSWDMLASGRRCDGSDGLQSPSSVGSP